MTARERNLYATAFGLSAGLLVAGFLLWALGGRVGVAPGPLNHPAPSAVTVGGAR